MAGPFNITPFSATEAIGMYRAGRQNRVAELEFDREQKKAQREQERADRISGILAKAYGSKGGDQASGDTAATAPSLSATPVAAGPSAMPTGAAPRIANPLMDPQVQSELIQATSFDNPSDAINLMKQFGELNDAQLKRAQEVYSVIGNAALWLRNTPPEQRQAAYQQLAPRLQAMGIPQESLARVDLSDRGLESLVHQGRDVEKIIEAGMPKTMPLQPGGTIGEYTPPSPYTDFGAQEPPAPAAPAASGAISDDRAASVIQEATRTGTIDQSQLQQLQGSFDGPNGVAALRGYLEKNKIAIRGANGQMGWIVNGKLYDNPEGR